MQEAQLKQLLKKSRNSITPERLLLFHELHSYNKPYSVSSLVSKLAHSMNKTTVYRNLDLFENLGITHRVYTGWKYKVELSDMFRSHHHHMTCNNCEAIISFEESEGFERELRKLERKHGFSATSHSLELRGICNSCHRNRFA